MTGTTLPAVRIPPTTPGQGSGEDSLGQDTVIVDLPMSNKFGFAWPAEQSPSVPISLVAERQVALSSSDDETDASEEEHSVPTMRQARPEDFGEDSDYVTPTNHLHSEQNPMDEVGEVPTLPRLSRAYSSPLPSQLGSLLNPRRVSMSFDPASPMMVDPFTELDHFRELSLELADSVQMVIQTLLQLSPPQLLDPAKEQFAACSLSIPTPSISAMFTSMKNLNYMSANMAALSADTAPVLEGAKGPSPCISVAQSDFDVGEMLQSIGDALSGVAAQAGIDLVLFHGDVGIKHIAAKGDESGVSYTLSHVIRQIIATSHRGDAVEVGLYIEVLNEDTNAREGDSGLRPSSPTSHNEPSLRCNFLITHIFTGEDLAPSGVAGQGAPEAIDSHRPQPAFNTVILRRLLRQIGATLGVDPASKDSIYNRSYEMSVVLSHGDPSVVDPTATVSPEDAAVLGYPNMQIAIEPSLEELLHFAETLRGKSVSLHASSKGSFAHHLSSYLTAWGMDVSHMSTEPDADGQYELVGEVSESSAPPLPVLDISTTPIPEPALSGSPPDTRRRVADPAFVLIDDDVGVLRTRLMKIRTEQAYSFNMQVRKRPSLAPHHRPRSSPQVARVLGSINANNPSSTPPAVIVHFTSLARFKLVKDVIQTILTPSQNFSQRIPEVIVIPKPAGPRRFLTALHTAITRPVVDPFFVPTATSPMSPGLHSISPFFSLAGPPRSPSARSSTSVRTGSDRATRSPKDFFREATASHAPPSPLGQSDNMEYFSDAAVKLGTSPATGLLIQSPDGQPTGIFFHPKPRTGPAPPSPNMERGRAQEGREAPARQRPYLRLPSGGDDRNLRASSFAISPPLVKPSNARHASVSSEPSEALPTTKGKNRQASSGSISEQTPPSSVEHNLATVTPTDCTPQGNPRLLARRQSLQAKDAANSPPSSPQIQSATKTRQLMKRLVSDSHTSAAGMNKKGKSGPDSNIVPPISVLIVDDNPINQTILSTFMKKKKIKFDVAKNGEEAVNKWRSGVFHLILMDIQMPVMDGIQATKEIRRIEKQTGTGGFPSTPQSEGQRTPSEGSTSDSRTVSTPPYRSSVIIVALTASALQADRVAALAAGCNDFLTKPVSLEWLNSKIIEWGSIKALQMWADIRPEVVKSISSGQTAQAQHVARRLHVPEGRSTTPSGERNRGISMAGRRASAENNNASPAERLNAQSTHATDESASGMEYARVLTSASNHFSPAFTGMTASEAALGLAAAHRPQAPVDAVRIPADVAREAVVPPPPGVLNEPLNARLSSVEILVESPASSATHADPPTEADSSLPPEGHTRPPSPRIGPQ